MPDENNPLIIGGINTNNQSGGENIQNFNFAPQPRHLTPALGLELLAQLNRPVGTTFNIKSSVGDAEALAYRNEIRDFLVSQGYVLGAETQVINLNGMTPGVRIIQGDNPVMIVVGPRP
jgi:hypothetical protein